MARRIACRTTGFDTCACAAVSVTMFSGKHRISGTPTRFKGFGPSPARKLRSGAPSSGGIAQISEYGHPAATNSARNLSTASAAPRQYHGLSMSSGSSGPVSPANTMYRIPRNRRLRLAMSTLRSIFYETIRGQHSPIDHPRTLLKSAFQVARSDCGCGSAAYVGSPFFMTPGS